jgi:hypothetical protein
MKAIVLDEYGSPDVLELREIDKPRSRRGPRIKWTKHNDLVAGPRRSDWSPRRHRTDPRSADMGGRCAHG